MISSAPIGVGVIGLGFMGQTHIRAYRDAAAAGLPCEIVSVCDHNDHAMSGVSRAVGNLSVDRNGKPHFDPATVRTCVDPDELFADPRVQLVSICSFTETHIDLALRALDAGKHVLVEKPVALTSADVRRLADAARNVKTLCMPAMCMRFWPAWVWLHDRIRDCTFGKVQSATFQRLGSRPSWSEFYADDSRSGGALFDLHIHDVDFIYWCFGKPQSMRTAGSRNHVTTLYQLDHGPPHVSAEGAWDLARSAKFRMHYLVNFERATADFEIGRDPQLMLHTDEKSETIDLGSLTGYDMEIRHLLGAIHDGCDSRSLRATIDEAVTVTELLEQELQNLTCT